MSKRASESPVLNLQLHGYKLSRLGEPDARIQAITIGPNTFQVALPEEKSGAQKLSYKCGVLATLGMEDMAITQRLSSKTYVDAIGRLRRLYEAEGHGVRRTSLGARFLMRGIYVPGEVEQHLVFDNDLQRDVLTQISHGQHYPQIAADLGLSGENAGNKVSRIVQEIKGNNGQRAVEVLVLAGLVDGSIPLPTAPISLEANG